ncbi:sulfatase-like hydrolase/transferase [Streptomyces sp. NBC_00162]|uniref:sulfatase-like hydrolase/transferase n=1 Tax=Streptomyces sp. NBC_00162 TaxID=2903629 RepID=UPI00214C6B6D|nr:sulfatase-like hydrolase/transferase [Streptomyces sp. NBC_00162]UUU43324.1 sulfatase-like hydrolase/transferase [Streptomyces sp. NBC_00162]
MSSRRHFLAGSAAALGLTALPAAASAAPAAARTTQAGTQTPSATRAPNLIVVLADDLGYGELGSYGQKLITTPRLDGLATEGLRFTDAYSTAAVCAPSRCSLLTGLHTGHSTVRANPSAAQGSLTATDTTFAQVLKARGYRTAVIGKWGFGPEAADQDSHPAARGFEEFYGYIDHSHAHQYYPEYLWHNGTKELIPANAGGAKAVYAPDLIEQHALEFIGAHQDEPFLLFLTPNVPHAPSDVPDTSAYAAQSWTAANKGHAAQVSYFDALVGKVVDRLRALGLEDDTVLLVTSDNGPHEEGGVNPDLFDANGPLRGYKRNLYEGGVRVPLIAWGPGRVAQGTSDRPTPLTDILPTLAELGGAPAPSDVDGLSAAPLLAGSPDAARHGHLYWFRDERGVTSRANAQDAQRATWLAEAVRRDNWKAVRFAPERDHNLPDDKWQVELYDLAADLGETRNVLDAHPSTAAALVALMRSSWQDSYPRKEFGVRLPLPQIAVPGQTFTVTASLANGSAKAWTSAALALRVPAGWTVTATTATTAGQLAAGARLDATWKVTPPADAPARTRWDLTAEGTALAPGGTVTYRASGTVPTPPPPPTKDSYLSDLEWISATNGWGPVERDASNGKNAAGDGPLIAFGGTKYSKGLGVHAPSDIAFHLGAAGNRFTALVGIDDFSAKQSPLGATRAKVYGDDRLLLTTPTLTAATGPVALDVDVRGVRVLRLLVEDANNKTSFDHTSWALARVTVV